MRGATNNSIGMFKSVSKFQSTPLCEGRQGCIKEIADILYVSIHAPVRGATTSVTAGLLSKTVSIHAPVRGATGNGTEDCDIIISFNPRPCARGDHQMLSLMQRRSKFQSTPLCEGRLPWHMIRKSLERFNPRPCARGDSGMIPAIILVFKFQSTPLCEGRRAKHLCNKIGCKVSIHAPVRGATKTIG